MPEKIIITRFNQRTRKRQRGSIILSTFGIQAGGGGGALSVNAQDETLFHLQGISPTVSGVRLDNDETIKISDADGVYSTSQSNYISNGGVADVWVDRVIDSGSFTTDQIGASRVSLTNSLIIENSDTDSGISAEAGIMTVSFWDAAAGGNLLDTMVLDLSANYDTT